MNSDKKIMYINLIILFCGLVAVAVLLLGRRYLTTDDLNIIPVILIAIYSGLNGVKSVIKGRQKTGYPLIFFSVIIVVIALVLKMTAA